MENETERGYEAGSPAGHDRMIVNVKSEHLDAWLKPAGRTHDELQTILSDRQTPYYEHEVMAA